MLPGRFTTVALMMLVSLASHAQSWSFAGQRYPDRTSAESARITLFEKVLTSVQPRELPAACSVKFVYPGEELVEVLLRARYPQVYDRFSADQRAYLRELGHSEYRLVADLVKRRNIFERVEIEELPGTALTSHVIPPSGGAAIYYYAPDRNTRSWYYSSEKTQVTPLHTDTGNPDFAARIKFMIDSIEVLAAGERSVADPPLQCASSPSAPLR